MGHNQFSQEEREFMLTVWYEQLERHEVPIEAYKPLLHKAIDARQAHIREHGLANAPFVDITLIISHWTGKHGMKAEWERQRIESGKYIESSLLGTCERCYGTAMESVYDDFGKKLGSRPGCKHEPIVEGEGIWKFLEREKAKGACG